MHIALASRFFLEEHMTQKDLLGDDWIPEEEFAKIVGVGVSTLQAQRSRKQGPPAAKHGKNWFYSRIAYREWMQKQISDSSEHRSRRRR